MSCNHRLHSLIDQNHILPAEKFGFRKQLPTVSQLYGIAEFITNGFNLRKHTDMVLNFIEKA